MKDLFDHDVVWFQKVVVTAVFLIIIVVVVGVRVVIMIIVVVDIYAYSIDDSFFFNLLVDNWEVQWQLHRIPAT